MALTYTGTQYLKGGGVITQLPITIAGWGWLSSAAVDTIHTIGVVNDFDNYPCVILGLSATTNKASAISVNGAGTTAAATTIATFTDETWVHVAGVFSSTTSRKIYLNGGAEVENTTSNVVGTTLQTYMSGAREANSTIYDYFVGKIAEVGYWDVALTPAEIASLATGVSPSKIRLSSLKHYLPQIRSLIDPRSGGPITFVSPPTGASDHPRIFY